MQLARRTIRFTVGIAVMLAEFGLGQVMAKTVPLTIEQLIDIKHPSNPIWAPNGKYVVFIWDRAGVSNLYLASSTGGGQPVPLTSFPEGGVEKVFWSQDSQTVYFARGGDLWQVAVSGGAPKTVWTAPIGESEVVPSPDGARVAFVCSNRAADEESSRHSELIVRSLADTSETAIASDEVSIHDIVWSPDGSSLAYTAGAKVIHHDEAPSYSGAKIIYRASEYTPGQIYALRLGGSQPVAIGTAAEYGGLAWLDNSHLVFDHVSNNFKTYTIYVADASGGPLRSVYEITEKDFWSIPDWGEAGAQPWPSPDGKWIAFLSDRDGWDHLYVVSASGGEATQVTKGHFEAWRPAWSHDSTRIAFDANEADRPGDRQIGIAAIGSDPAHAVITYITGGNGTNIEPHWSADDKRLVYQHTDTRNSADFFVDEAKANAKAVRLSDSMPASIDKSQFVEPQFVHFPGPDGKTVPGWLFIPPNLDRSKKYPAIIWVHGDGVNQNYDGWHVQRNYAVYYSFHQYLLQQGYIVFAPDYRGSIGYGRDWRNGVYMDVGGKDAKDAWMSANFLKTLPYVDADRIGIWGLSYGGFFTLIAMTDQPTLFKAGVDVAGVVDYVMYYSDPYHGDWTESRIGRPEQNPQVYAQASPISHIDRLARPLLVLHGTADVNVPYLESVWLIDEALKKNKGALLSYMMYPGEFHYFTRAHVLDDAWHRVDDFFGFHLQGRINRRPQSN
ncbi:MAG: S9 family peptidase [Acidobacteriia bacterium]|nr:S9 family peptidase [Terriglobia bacterium]